MAIVSSAIVAAWLPSRPTIRTMIVLGAGSRLASQASSAGSSVASGPVDHGLGVVAAALGPNPIATRWVMVMAERGLSSERSSGGIASPVAIASRVAAARASLPCKTRWTASAIEASASASRLACRVASARWTPASEAGAGTPTRSVAGSSGTPLPS